MKFVVQKTKTSFYEDEYRVSLPEKTMKRLRIAGFLAVTMGPGAVLVAYAHFADKTKNDPETTESP